MEHIVQDLDVDRRPAGRPALFSFLYTRQLSPGHREWHNHCESNALTEAPDASVQGHATSPLIHSRSSANGGVPEPRKSTHKSL